MDLSTITAKEFKDFFCKDFPDSTEKEINRAFMEARFNFNQAILGDDEGIRLAYYYITAHYLVMDARAVSGGAGATGSFPVSSRSVGSVSESYDIPQAYKDSPTLSYYTSTPYGMKYLSLIYPLLVGNVGVVCGRTLP